MLGDQAFCNSKSTRIEGIQWMGTCELIDLPNLQAINLGIARSSESTNNKSWLVCIEWESSVRLLFGHAK